MRVELSEDSSASKAFGKTYAIQVCEGESCDVLIEECLHSKAGLSGILPITSGAMNRHG